MGYNTTFKGELKFTKTDLPSGWIEKLESMLDEDCRDHPEWNRTDLTYIDLELTPDMSGLVWNGSEKTYELVEKVNLIIDQMKLVYPDFGLEGEMLAQGEAIDDRWILQIVDGYAQETPVKNIPSTGWYDFSGVENIDEFNRRIQLDGDCLVKFDDGTICRYKEEHPMAVLTHFK